MKSTDTTIAHIALAFDAFKGSLSSDEVAAAFEEGLHTVLPHCMTHKIRIADGGEGTLDTLIEALNGEYISVPVSNPLGRTITACYGRTDSGTAIIEMAKASGLPLLSPSERNPLTADTYGTGQFIAHALNEGCRHIILCIGGSATNDGGTGMLRALGYRFLDAMGNELTGGGAILSHIHHIDDARVIPTLRNTHFTIACDVDNPLYGPKGAAHIFAPQKGADTSMVHMLDEGLHHFAEIIRLYNGKDVAHLPGAGAAGGMGAALMAFMNSTFERGIDIVLRTVRFKEHIRNCQWVVTGEGKLDRQTMMGKAPMGILRMAQSLHIPVIAIGGSVENAQELQSCGFASILCVNDTCQPLHIAMQHDIAMENVRRAGRKVAMMLSSGEGS